MNAPNLPLPTRVRGLLGTPLFMLALVMLALPGCESVEPKIKIPARVSYMQAEGMENQGILSDAIAKYQEIADQNPGTLLGSFSFLKMGDLNFSLENWEEAEINYRLFLTTNQNSHLTSYILYKLVVVQHRKSITGIFFPSREIERNMEPNRKIIQEFQRFFFLYPNSVFLREIRTYLGEANQALAAHEHMVADFYFERELFNAAVSRYLYLLKKFPNYPDSEVVLKRLIQSYRRNQQPGLAEELERFYKTGFERWRKSGKNTDAAGPRASSSTFGDPSGEISARETRARGNPVQETHFSEKNHRGNNLGGKAPRGMTPREGNSVGLAG